MFSGKCPKCENTVNVRYRGVSAQQKNGMNKIPVVSFCCSQCDTILGVETDPIALKNDIVNALKRR